MSTEKTTEQDLTDSTCTFCGSDIREHDPVFVNEGIEDRREAGQFCNYACLARHIEEENLEAGACCRVDLT